jgi:hypothetical protein
MSSGLSCEANHCARAAALVADDTDRKNATWFRRLFRSYFTPK